jgi:hypothetical protein
MTIPVTVTSNNSNWVFPEFKDNFDVSGFNAAFNNRTVGTPASDFVFTTETASETATYSIQGTFCESSTGVSDTVLLATHGITLDRKYVDFLEFVTNVKVNMTQLLGHAISTRELQLRRVCHQ